MNRKLTATLLILAAVLANVAFTALGSIFDYPDVLDDPAGTVLAAFRDSQDAVGAWFLVLALSAALLAPIAIGAGRLFTGKAMRIAVPVGITAAVVQVVGLLRWPLLVPGYASDAASGNAAVAHDARDTFTTVSDILGTAIGETLGYALTATWTVLVVVALGRRYAGRWFQVLGVTAAVLVFVGVFSPLDIEMIDTANFFGYVLWSVWLIAFGVLILVHERRTATSSSARVAVGDVMTAATATRTWPRAALRWLPTFLGFPLGGLVAEHVSGPVDGLVAALVGGAITGLILGAVQSWGLGPNGPATLRWTLATGAGFAVGLGAGAAAVDYGTSMGDLIVQGAICGLAVGVAQATVLRPRLGNLALAWIPILSALWALGWAITTAVGVDVESQYTVFGSSGALVVTLATAVLPVVLAHRAAASAS